MSRVLAVPLMASFLAGCVTEENFPDRAGTVACQRFRECDKSAFENTYDDIGECYEDAANTYEQLMDFFDLGDCEFISAKAQECLNEMRAAPCGGEDAETPACDEIYDCP